MVTPQVHIIQKVFIEVEAPDLDSARTFQVKLGTYMRETILPEIEQRLNRLDTSKAAITYRFPRVEVQIALPSGSDLFASDKSLVREIVTCIQKELGSPDSITEVSDVSKGNDKMELLFYFLEKGTLPWWFNRGSGLADMESLVRNGRDLRYYSPRLKTLLLRSNVRKRLIKQFRHEDILRFLIETFPHNELLKTCHHSIQILGFPPGDMSKDFLDALCCVVVTDQVKPLASLFSQPLYDEQDNGIESNEKASYWKSLYSKIRPNLPPKNSEENRSFFDPGTGGVPASSHSKALTEETIPHASGEDFEFYADNAGLILLHPFLLPFFKTIGILEEDHGISNPELAIHLLHYAATKKEYDWEHNMTFEKFLCGISVDTPISRNVHLSAQHKEETEALLQSVLVNWEVLQNASTDLLRNEFLQRPGKVSIKSRNPKVTVASKVQDILMNKIPWTIGVCKLPWLDTLIFTDWN